MGVWAFVGAALHVTRCLPLAQALLTPPACPAAGSAGGGRQRAEAAPAGRGAKEVAYIVQKLHHVSEKVIALVLVLPGQPDGLLKYLAGTASV